MAYFGRRIDGTVLRVIDTEKLNAALRREAGEPIVRPASCEEVDSMHQPPLSQPDKLRAVDALQMLLLAEAQFYDSLLNVVEERDRDTKIFETIRDDRTMNVARFFFLIDAMRIDDEIAIGRFVDEHNAAMDAEIEIRHVTGQTTGELERAKFSINRRSKLMTYFNYAGRPVFERKDILDFMILMMTKTQSRQIIDALIRYRLLETRDVDPLDVTEAARRDGATQRPRASKALITAWTTRTETQTQPLVEHYGRYLLTIRAALRRQPPPGGEGDARPAGPITR